MTLRNHRKQCCSHQSRREENETSRNSLLAAGQRSLAHPRTAYRRNSESRTWKDIPFLRGFNGVRNVKLFHLSDAELLARVDAIHRAWGKSVSFGTRYERVRGGDHYIFSVPPNRAWTKYERMRGTRLKRASGISTKQLRTFWIMCGSIT